MISAKGREILQNTKTLVEKLNFEVIYGDTDSIMINTNNLNYDEAYTIAKKVKLLPMHDFEDNLMQRFISSILEYNYLVALA